MLGDYLLSVLPTDLARVRKLLHSLKHLLEAFLPEGGCGASTAADAATTPGAEGWRLAFARLKLTIDRACRLHYGADRLEI